MSCFHLNLMIFLNSLAPACFEKTQIINLVQFTDFSYLDADLMLWMRFMQSLDFMSFSGFLHLHHLSSSNGGLRVLVLFDSSS